MLDISLYIAARTMQTAYGNALRELGFPLTFTQYIVLREMRSADGGSEESGEPAKVMTERELALRLGLDSGTLSPLLKKMAAQGLLTRSRGREDERVLIVELTEEGKRMIDAIGPLPVGLDEKKAGKLESLLSELTVKLDR